MENKETLEPRQSLQLIEKMIAEARNQISDNGHLYLVWGWVILICSLFHFAGIYWSLFPRPDLVWMATWLAFLYQMIYLRRKARNIKVNTYAGDILKAVWLVFFGCGVVTAVVILRKFDWEAMYPLILMLYGIPTILSGTILRFKPLVFGGIACWVLSIVGSFLPLLYNLLLVSVAVLIAWIIPGYLLAQRYQIQKMKSS